MHESIHAAQILLKGEGALYFCLTHCGCFKSRKLLHVFLALDVVAVLGHTVQEDVACSTGDPSRDGVVIRVSFITMGLGTLCGGWQ